MSNQPSRDVDDPYDGRTPTSHERMAGAPWDASYQHGRAPWDIGRPQPAVAALSQRVTWRSPVLDVGCGSGENALLIAMTGATVVGVDVARTAVDLARSKARERGIPATFEVGDALSLARVGHAFSSVLDSGLFHSFDSSERSTYLQSLASVTVPGATFYLLCFSDEGDDLGPHPVSAVELRDTVERSGAWTLEDLRPEILVSIYHPDGAPAWLATCRRR